LAIMVSIQAVVRLRPPDTGPLARNSIGMASIRAIGRLELLAA